MYNFLPLLLDPHFFRRETQNYIHDTIGSIWIRCYNPSRGHASPHPSCTLDTQVQFLVPLSTTQISDEEGHHVGYPHSRVSSRHGVGEFGFLSYNSLYQLPNIRIVVSRLVWCRGDFWNVFYAEMPPSQLKWHFLSLEENTVQVQVRCAPMTILTAALWTTSIILRIWCLADS